MHLKYSLVLLFISMSGLDGLLTIANAQKESHPAFTERVDDRFRMVKNDIENYPHMPVKDSAVLSAMRRVPRHVFIPEDLQDYAYDNRPLPIGYNQTISQPVIVAHMTELLGLNAASKVLEIGTGSGYQAAVLAEICNAVYTMEIIPALGKRATALLEELGYIQIRVRIGNGYEGWPEKAPFDRMIVTCAPDDVPQALIDQLAPGGRIVIPVGHPWETQHLVLVRKNQKGKIITEKQYPVRFVPMTGKKLSINTN